MTNLNKYNRSVPRYTSYPTAPHFKIDVSHGQYATWLQNVKDDEAVSLYLHIPFCQQLCWYCGCNTKVINKYDPLEQYVQSLLAEIKTVVSLLGQRLRVTHIHWGGGTPTLLSEEDFKRISDTIYDAFDVQDQAEIAVEIDPRTMTSSMAQTLVDCGVNRVSFGVQDFDDAVQQAINRVQPYDMVEKVVNMFSEKGMNSINFDLIYGLPKQSLQTIQETIQQTLTLAPSRIALFGYAHVPWMKKHQLLLEKEGLPSAEERHDMAEYARKLLVEGGYKEIGLDHFCQEEDELYQSLKEGELKRNFQGYTTDTAKTLIAFGASSIGQLPQGYIQNVTSVKEYNDLIARYGLATEKGLELSQDDIIRADVIEKLMCAHQVDLAQITQDYGVEKHYFVVEENALKEYAKDGLVELSNQQVRVTESGEKFIRVIASVFDVYLQKGIAQHSKAV